VFGSKPVRVVDDTDLRTALRRVGRDRGAGRTAQRMLGDLRQLYRWSLSRKPWRALVPEGSPAELVDARQVVNDDYEEGIRERVLSEAEIRELHEIQVGLRTAYESLSDGHRAVGIRPMKRENELAIWIMLSTLCRAGETLKAEWKDVDLAKAECFLPAPNTKTKVSMLVYLSPFALRQFEELQTLTGHTRWCFPSRPKGRIREGARLPDRHVHEKSASKQVGDRQMRFMNREGSLDHRKHDNSLVPANGERGVWTLHDLRRTGGTLCRPWVSRWTSLIAVRTTSCRARRCDATTCTMTTPTRSETHGTGLGSTWKRSWPAIRPPTRQFVRPKRSRPTSGIAAATTPQLLPTESDQLGAVLVSAIALPSCKRQIRERVRCRSQTTVGSRPTVYPSVYP